MPPTWYMSPVPSSVAASSARTSRHPKRAHSGCSAAAASSRSSQSGSGNASGLSSATNSQSSLICTARLFAAAKPRFSVERTNSTNGKRASSPSSEPSSLALSTTITRLAGTVWWRRLSSAVARCGPAFLFTITTETRSLMSPSRRAASGRAHARREARRPRPHIRRPTPSSRGVCRPAGAGHLRTTSQRRLRAS